MKYLIPNIQKMLVIILKTLQSFLWWVSIPSLMTVTNEALLKKKKKEERNTHRKQKNRSMVEERERP